MRPIPIPPAIREEWAAIGAEFQVMSAPNGDLTDPEVGPIEVASYLSPVYAAGGVLSRDDQPVTSVVITLEEGDLDNLRDTGLLVLSVWGHGFPIFMMWPCELAEEGSGDG